MELNEKLKAEVKQMLWGCKFPKKIELQRKEPYTWRVKDTDLKKLPGPSAKPNEESPTYASLVYEKDHDGAMLLANLGFVMFGEIRDFIKNSGMEDAFLTHLVHMSEFSDDPETVELLEYTYHTEMTPLLDELEEDKKQLDKMSQLCRDIGIPGEDDDPNKQ